MWDQSPSSVPPERLRCLSTGIGVGGATACSRDRARLATAKTASWETYTCVGGAENKKRKGTTSHSSLLWSQRELHYHLRTFTFNSMYFTLPFPPPASTNTPLQAAITSTSSHLYSDTRQHRVGTSAGLPRIPHHRAPCHQHLTLPPIVSALPSFQHRCASHERPIIFQ